MYIKDSDMMSIEVSACVDVYESEFRGCYIYTSYLCCLQVYLKANVNLGELTDTIISQNYVGSVMKVWEDNIYIFISMASYMFPVQI